MKKLRKRRKGERKLSILLLILAAGLFFIYYQANKHSGLEHQVKPTADHNPGTVAMDPTAQPTQKPEITGKPTQKPEITGKPTAGPGEDTTAVEPENGSFSIHYLDVGNGAAALVQCDGYAMLLDGGDRSHSSYVVSYLKKQGITKLTYAVASHYDSDHISGLVGALHVFETEQFLGPDYETDTAIYESLTRILSEKQLSICTPSTGAVYPLGSAVITVLYQGMTGAEEENSHSMVLMITYGEKRFYFGGDATVSEEQAMLAEGILVDCDVYLVSHHGSNSSNSAQFLAQTGAEAAIISVGLENGYGHPGEFCLKRLKEAGMAIYRTDLQGEIIVTSDGSSVQYSCKPWWSEPIP